MRILHVCLNGPFTDGWNYQENMLSRYHVRLGHDVFVLTSKWCWGEHGKMIKSDKSTYKNADGVSVVRLELKGKDSFDKKFKTYSGVYNTITDIAPNVIFIHSCAFCDIPVIVKYLKSNPDCIAYADNHADYSNSATSWLSKHILYPFVWRHYARMLLPVVKKFYGVMPARVDFIVQMYGFPKEKCEYLPMGADDELVEFASEKKVIEDTRKQYGITTGDFLIVTGGKIDPWKTQTVLLMEAVKRMSNRRVKLIVFGSIDDELKCKTDKLFDGERIIYAGWKNSIESYELFAASDLVVFPGRHSVFWEQVAGQGKPMIVKYWEGTQHVDVGGNVRFIKKDSVEEIQEMLERLLDNPNELEEMRYIAKTKGKEMFSYKDISMRCICL